MSEKLVRKSAEGMKKIYGKSAMLVKCDGFIYNVPKEIYDKAY